MLDGDLENGGHFGGFLRKKGQNEEKVIFCFTVFKDVSHFV